MNEKEFIDSIFDLPNGDRAVLKRNCGVMLKDADGKALTVFYRCLPYDVPVWAEPYYFAAACFSCLWKTPGTEKLERCFSRMGRNSGTLEKRLTDLMDMTWDEDGFFLAKLSRTIKMAASAGYQVNCADLLKDLMGWNHNKRYVQRKWIKAFYMNQTEREEN